MKISVICFVILVATTSFSACHVASASATKQNAQQQTKPAAVVDQKPGIHFIEDDWSQALQTAHTSNKLVFLDIYATWCGPCKMLRQYTFTDAKVGNFFNKNFISVSVDGEKGVGPQLAQKYNIEGYPTLVVADETGKVVLITAGYIPADVLMQFANEALKRNGRQPIM